MFPIFILATGSVILGATGFAYSKTRDVLHPLIYLGPMLFYQYVFAPARLWNQDALAPYFPDLAVLDSVLMLNLLGVGLFCLGTLYGIKWTPPSQRLMARPLALGSVARRRVQTVGVALGTVALIAYNYMVYVSGGYWHVYSRAKGSVGGGSGYIGDATLLAYPAVILLALSWQGRALRLKHYASVLLFISPNLIVGTLGARRGPLFLSLATLALAWYLVRVRRPSLRGLLVGLVAIGMAVFFVKAHRSEIYLGSDFRVDPDAVVDELAVSRGEVGSGDDFIAASGTVLMASNTGRYYWGRRYFATYVVRPIPRQLWPNKYHDLGVGAVMGQASMMGFTDGEWTRYLGFVPTRGAAIGFAADLFIEFWWAALFFCWLIGRFYGYLWGKANTGSGLWALLYFQAAALSIYIPTQSVSAVFQRLLFVAIPTALLWKYQIEPWLRRRRARRPMLPRVGSGPVVKQSVMPRS